MSPELRSVRTTSSARGFGRQGKRLHLLRTCGTQPVLCSLGARQSPLIKKEQAAGGSTGREETPSLRLGCVRASRLGPWGWLCPAALASAFSSCRQALGCRLFFFKAWSVVPAVPRRCQGAGLACPPGAGDQGSRPQPQGCPRPRVGEGWLLPCRGGPCSVFLWAPTFSP